MFYKMQDDFLKNQLLTATPESNTRYFTNVRKMTGLQMYETILSVYQGTKYKEDKAVNAASDFKMLKLTRNSHLSPETFLVKVYISLKRMEVHDGKGATRKPDTDALLQLWQAEICQSTK